MVGDGVFMYGGVFVVGMVMVGCYLEDDKGGGGFLLCLCGIVGLLGGNLLCLVCYVIFIYYLIY